MNRKAFFIPIGLFIISCLSLNRAAAQIDSLLGILEKDYPQEKIYIQYDRPYYNTGETIWFKAYLFAANIPSIFSKTMYAELINENGDVLERKTLPVFGAGAAGDFSLPDTMRSSLLYVRAYTAWMMNFDSSFYYLKPIRIIGSTQAKAEKPKEPQFSLQFFPEGGTFVQGVESRIAFKATDDQGFPIVIRGDIVNSKQQKIISFSGMHDGMGYFQLLPLPGETYKAIWKDSKGLAHETPLPVAKDNGVVLSVENINNGITYTIARSETLPPDQRVFQVVAHVQQTPVYIAKVNMSARNKVTAPIPTDDFPDGIVHVTLFSENNRPLAERIVFINRNNYYFITDIHTREKNFTKKGKNSLQVDVGDTLLSSLSISVTDAGSTSAPREEENIFSHVLLSSDIKGYVYDPSYYFSSKDDSVLQHLDLVMMTHGWRRFKWDDVIAGRWPVIKSLPQPYVTVNGQILGLLQTDLVGKDLSMILETKQRSTQFLTVPITPKGEFSVANLIFYDTAKLYYQINNDKGKKLTSTASFNFKNSFINWPGKPLTGLLPQLKPVVPDSSAQKKNELLARLRKDEYIEGMKVKTLEGVEVISRQKSTAQKMDEEYTSGFFSGGDGYTFIVGDDPNGSSYRTVLDYLQGKVAGLQISSVGPEGASLSWRGGSPSLFVNEMNADVNLIQSTQMSDVAMIKVFRPPFFGAVGGGAGGAIAVYTKKGAAANSAVKGLDFVSVNGYSAMREFYSPDYSQPGVDKARNDFRTTLYWNPYLVFDKQTRRVMIPFYNNDNCKRIRVVIEGVNEQGKMTREEKYFE